MSFPLFLHINYCEPWHSLDAVFDFARRTGYDGVEVRREAPAGMESAVYADRIVRAMDRSGVGQVIIGTPPLALAHPDPGERRRSLDGALEFYDRLRRQAHVPHITLSCGSIKDPEAPTWAWDRHGSRHAREEHWEWAAAGLRELGAWLESAAMTAGLETHMFTLHDTLASTRRLLDQVACDRLGVTLDVSNLLAMPNPPTLSEILAGLAERTVSMHWKNVSRTFGGAIVPARLKDGEVDHRRLVRHMLEIRAPFPVVLEAPAAGDKSTWAVEDLAYIRALQAAYVETPS